MPHPPPDSSPGEVAAARVFLIVLLESPTVCPTEHHAMIELNPIRQRIADLSGRLDALRGYL